MSGEDFCVTTPMRCVSSGSLATVCATRFWTCTCAMSGSVPCSNVSVIDAIPADEDDDEK